MKKITIVLFLLTVYCVNTFCMDIKIIDDKTLITLPSKEILYQRFHENSFSYIHNFTYVKKTLGDSLGGITTTVPKTILTIHTTLEDFHKKYPNNKLVALDQISIIMLVLQEHPEAIVFLKKIKYLPDAC